MFLPMALVAMTAWTGCNNSQQNPAAAVPAETDTTVVDTVVDREPEPETVAPVRNESPAPRTVAKPRQKAEQTEQLYVTGYNSYGRLWGYVTMTGDKGTGVIHDAEENHYNVHCTRHGNELFAVDQNSRQYVLKY